MLLLLAMCAGVYSQYCTRLYDLMKRHHFVPNDGHDDNDTGNNDKSEKDDVDADDSIVQAACMACLSIS